MIEKNKKTCDGSAFIENTHIPIWLLVNAKEEGATDDELLANFPRLTKMQLRAAWEYYESHRKEIEADLRKQDLD